MGATYLLLSVLVGAVVSGLVVHRLTRKLNGGNVVALVFVALVGGGLVFGLVSWALAVTATPFFFWTLVAVAAAVGLFAIALAAVGLGQLYGAIGSKEWMSS